MLIVCNGMLRSGSTLQYNIVRNLLQEMNLGRGEGFFRASQFEDHEESFLEWAQDDMCHVIKAHEIYPKSSELVPNGLMKICYIYRDIRDVAFSAKNKFGYKGEKLLRNLDIAVSIYNQMKDIDGVCWQRYEDVMLDVHGATREIAKYIGLSPPDDVIESVANRCSLDDAIRYVNNVNTSIKVKYFIFRYVDPLITKIAKKTPESVKVILRKSGITRIVRKVSSPQSRYDQDTLMHPDHISKDAGVVGIWQEGLDEKEIETISGRYRQWLSDAGYG